MPGEDDLRTLLQHMKPEMQDGIFVFCSLPGARTSRPHWRRIFVKHRESQPRSACRPLKVSRLGSRTPAR